MTHPSVPSSSVEAPAIELRMFNLIREYVERRARARSGIDNPRRTGEDGKTWYPKEYREACEKICSDAFYRLRACKSREDFMRYFADTICSVPHNLSRDNYQLIAGYLIKQDDSWQDLKSLAMLALSKFSYFSEDGDSAGGAPEQAPSSDA
jgi:CRISPR-associated protein Cmx8